MRSVPIISEIGLKPINSKNIQARFNYNKYYFEYESVVAERKPQIVVETNFFLEAFPTKKQEIKSFVGDFCNSKGISLPVKFNESDFNKVTKKLLYEDMTYEDVINRGIKKVINSNIF